MQFIFQMKIPNFWHLLESLPNKRESQPCSPHYLQVSLPVILFWCPCFPLGNLGKMGGIWPLFLAALLYIEQLISEFQPVLLTNAEVQTPPPLWNAPPTHLHTQTTSHKVLMVPHSLWLVYLPSSLPPTIIILVQEYLQWGYVSSPFWNIPSPQPDPMLALENLLHSIFYTTKRDLSENPNLTFSSSA